jgi:hypothetical protein
LRLGRDGPPSAANAARSAAIHALNDLQEMIHKLGEPGVEPPLADKHFFGVYGYTITNCGAVATAARAGWVTSLLAALVVLPVWLRDGVHDAVMVLVEGLDPVPPCCLADGDPDPGVDDGEHDAFDHCLVRACRRLVSSSHVAWDGAPLMWNARRVKELLALGTAEAVALVNVAVWRCVALGFLCGSEPPLVSAGLLEATSHVLEAAHQNDGRLWASADWGRALGALQAAAAALAIGWRLADMQPGDMKKGQPTSVVFQSTLAWLVQCPKQCAQTLDALTMFINLTPLWMRVKLLRCVRDVWGTSTPCMW